MKPSLFVLTLTAAVTAACYDTSSPNPPRLFLTPILDSLFVGDSKPPRTVTLLDANRQPQNPGPVTWTIDPDTVATIDPTTGEIHGVGKGAAIVTAHAAGLTAPALVIVSRPLDMTLLMDTVYLMPGDTFTIPVAIQKKDAIADSTIWFDPSPDAARYTIDTAKGLVTAVQSGGFLGYIAHIATSTDTVSQAGAVRVLPADGTANGFFLTVVGTAIRHESGPVRAMNYTKQNGESAFRLTDSLFNADTTFYEKVYVTLLNAVTGTGTFEIDSLNPQEAATSIGTLSAFCNPQRPWAVWSNILPLPGIRAYSNTADKHPVAGELSITQYGPVTGGYAISGRFKFTAQRTDLYYDTLGVLTVRGTFVAPLVENTATCQQ